MREAWLYIMSNHKNGPLYVGVTNNIVRRATEHRTGAVKGFTTRHGLRRLVYLERHESVAAAIQRETTIKGWSRAWKVRLINSINPNWNDLYETIQA